MGDVSKSLGAWWSDRRSLRWKLPWLLVLVSGAAVATFGVVAHRTVRRVALESAITRLKSALTQVATVTELGVVQHRAILDTVARTSAVRLALRNAEAPPSPAAVAALDRLRGLADSNVVIELLDRNGRVIHASPATTTGTPRSVQASIEPTIGPMQEVESRLFFESTILVVGGRDTLGSIGVKRYLRDGANRRMVANAVPGALLLTGNMDGEMWGASGRSRYPALSSATEWYEHSDARWLTVAGPIRDTPWRYAVELPERVALAPDRALILPFTLAGLFVTLAAALLGLRMSRRITEPLATLTMATEAVARGETDVVLPQSIRTDEIGRLARAFVTMASDVRTRRTTLEQEITQRTGELSIAIRELQSLNEELRQSERLANLGRLSGSVGHELRNPLGVMSNIVFLIEAMPGASPTLKDYAALLREQIRVSERIIADLLDRARSGAPLRSAANVARVIDETVTRADVPPGVQVKRYLELPSLPLMIDRDHVSQILWNLVRNAVQAMDGSGTITLIATHVDGRLRIEVRDTGKGISVEDVERVFQPMFTTKSQGTGLGLSVSRAFARASGGDLYAVPGAGGACFVLEVPADVATGKTYTDASAAETPPSTAHVRRESPRRPQA